MVLIVNPESGPETETATEAEGGKACDPKAFQAHKGLQSESRQYLQHFQLLDKLWGQHIHTRGELLPDLNKGLCTHASTQASSHTERSCATHVLGS